MQRLPTPCCHQVTPSVLKSQKNGFLFVRALFNRTNCAAPLNSNHIFVLKTKIRFVFLSKEPCNVIAFSQARIYYFILFGCFLVNLFLARKKMCLRGFSLYYPYPSTYTSLEGDIYIQYKKR